jgi:anti-sigma regulatory factor (Ser/Thr protein kinase)
MTLSARRSFPPDPRSAAAARAFVVSHASQFAPETLEMLELLSCELATNAILHARTEFTVEMSVRDDGGRVRIAVTDGSPVPPVARTAGPSAVSGRGLAIIDRVTDDWGHDIGVDGKTVWFELEPPMRTKAPETDAALAG